MIKKSLLYILGTAHSMSMCLINTLVNFLTAAKSMYKAVHVVTKMWAVATYHSDRFGAITI